MDLNGDLGMGEWPPELVEKVQRDRAARETIRDGNPTLFAAISSAMFRHDPVHINFGKNTDEYDAEAGTVLPRLSACTTSEEVENVLREEFSNWFGADIAGRCRYGTLAEEIWEIWVRAAKVER